MNKALSLLGVAALSASLASCSGGGGSSPISPPVATPTPVVTSPTPTPGPTATPTSVPLALRQIGGAPLTATASQLSSARRSAQAKTKSQGVENGLPVLVESSGMVAAWAGDQAVWSTNIATSQDVAETGLTVTPSGTLPLNNPGPTPLSCLGQVSAVCAVHPMGWEFGTSSANGKPVGKQTLTATFADGTTGATHDYVYDGFALACNTGFVYTAGVPVATTTKAASDVYADCPNGNIVFPRGGILYANPIQDQYARVETAFPQVTAAILFSSFITNIPMTSIAQGVIFGIATQDGGSAKVLFESAGASGTVISSLGMSLHANADGTYPF